MDLQKLIDTELAKHPDWAPYYEWVRYVPQGEDLPAGTTAWASLHVLNGKQWHSVRVAARGEGFLATFVLGGVIAGLSPLPDGTRLDSV